VGHGDPIDGHIDALLVALDNPALMDGVLHDLSRHMLAQARVDRDEPVLAMLELTAGLVAVCTRAGIRAIRDGQL
jgi:hypothetical protein